MSQFSVIVYDINYDTDGKKIDLPQVLHMTFAERLDDEEMDEAISDEISDITGFCHKGFQWRPDYLKNIAALSTDDPLADLITLAHAASQDQWHLQQGVKASPEVTSGSEFIIGDEGASGELDQAWANAAYIAAACPKNMLPLFKELAEYRRS